MCKVIGYNSFSELPGIHLEVGTRTVRSAMLINCNQDQVFKEERKKMGKRQGLY